MKNVKATRYAAVVAAQEALIERVRNNPEKVLDGLLQAPHLLHGIHDADTMFDIMLEKGLHGKLVQLAGARGLPKYLLKTLVGKLL